MKTCWGINLPKVCVVYVYPVAGGIYDANASRFVHSLRVCPAGYPNELWVVSNGGNPRKDMVNLFDGLDAHFVTHDNSGWDIGAFQLASKNLVCDLMVFMGSSAYVTGTGWLERMVEASIKHGWSLYGSTASGADPGVGVHDHIRTTGFWCAPELIAEYPYSITTGGQRQRYVFEHGITNMTKWAETNGATPLMVTWHGEYEKHEWASAPEAFRNGNQTAVIVRDRICDPPYWPPK